jgi:hypothetical protein
MALEKIITMEELFQGEAFRRGNFTCPSSEEIVTPYFEKTRDIVDEYRIKVWQSTETVIESTSTAEIDEIVERPVFTRVHIDGILQDRYQIDLDGDIHNNVISMLYAVDVQNPIAKIYTGFERSACLNLSVFNPRHILEKKFADVDFNGIYEIIPNFIDNVEAYKIEYTNAFDALHNTRYIGEQLFDAMGRLAFKCVSKPGMLTAFNNSVRFLQSNQDVNGVKNLYFNRNWREEGYSAFDIHQCMTATLSNRGLKEPDKIYQAYKLIVG